MGNKDLQITILDDKTPTAVERAEASIKTQWAGQPGRINQARAFIKRAKKSDARRKIEKQTRKAQRKRRH